MATTDISTSRPSAGGRGSRLPLVAVCLGYFMVILDVTVVTVAVPAIGVGLRTGVTRLQWVVDGYTLVFAGLLLFCGGLGDRLGGRPVFLAGLVVFVLTSAGCGIAPTAGLLILARLVQGAGAALMVPASLSLLQTAYADAAARARAFGVWGMIAGVAAGAGPVLGGVLVSALGWRAVFLVNLPVGIVAVVLTVRYVPRRPATRRRRGLDLPAQVAAVVSLAGLTAGLNEAGSPSIGWAHPIVLGAFGAFAAGLVAFLVLEHRSPTPMLPLSLFGSPAFSASAAVGVLLNLGFYGWLFITPLYFQQVHHYGALRTGLALLPTSGVVAVSSALAGRVTARTGPGRPMTIGLLTGAVGLAGQLVATSHASYAALVAPMVLVGFGMAFTMPASTTAIMWAAPDDKAGAASAVFTTGRQVGSAIGVALFGTLAAGGLVRGLHAGVIVGAAGFITAAALTVLFVGPAGVLRPRRPAGEGRTAR
jgi:DHA2 family methylenomycin A resistance protein-like MFS transporter